MRCLVQNQLYNFDCLLIDATVYVGGLDEKVSEAILWELFLQAGPVGKILCDLAKTEDNRNVAVNFCNYRYGKVSDNGTVFCVLSHYISVNTHMPKDRVTQMHQGYGFIEFMGEEDADYAIKVMNMIKIYGKPIRVNKVSLNLFYTNKDHAE